MSEEKTEIQEYIDAVAKELGEKDEKPVGQIVRMVEHLGRDWVQSMVDETNKIEEKDGMKTDDGKRRRTKGGVFFYICKGKMDDEAKLKVFPNFALKGKVVEWEERHEHIDELMDSAEHGNMRYVTITLHGRPGKIIKEGNSIMTTISHVHKKTPFPKGVPHPPEETATIYTVYIGMKQWIEVEESITEYKSDRLIVEGTVFLDTETETIAVYATRVTTRRLEKQTKKDQKPTGASAANRASKQQEAMPEKSPVSKLEQLRSAADKLRERVADMEEKGQRGVNMTKQLLKNTEKQIEALEKNQAK